jgi:ribonuclease P protein component
LRRGKRWHGKWLTIYWVDHQCSTRWGVHIAKKVARYAIQRNISKRAIFAVIDDV